MKYNIIIFLLSIVPLFADARYRISEAETNQLDYENIEMYVRKIERDSKDKKDYTIETKLGSIAVLGFAEWANTILCQNVNIEIFRFNPTDSISNIVSPSNTISLHYYPQYNNIDIPALLDSEKILVNVRMLNFREFYAVQLTALIPLSTSSESELKFLKLNINNDFGLKLRNNFLVDRDTNEAVKVYIENIDFQDIVSFNGFISYSFMSDFEWILISSYILDHSIMTFQKTSLPKSLSEIFYSHTYDRGTADLGRANLPHRRGTP